MGDVDELTFDNPETCPNCGQFVGHDSVCPNCGAVLSNDDEDEMSVFDEDTELDR